MSFHDEESIIFKLNTDKHGNPTSTIATEQHQVDSLKNLIQLVQLPDHLQSIEVIDSKGQRMTQVKNTDAVLKDNEIRISFNQGLIYFAPSRKKETFTIKYYARGVELISINRIFSPDQGSLSLTDVIVQINQALGNLSGVIDDAREELDIIEQTHGGLIPAYNHLKEATAEGEKVNTKLTATNTEAKQTNATLEGNIATGSQLNQSLEQKINTGNQTVQNLQNTTNAGNQTNNTLNTTIQTGNNLHTTLQNDIREGREVDDTLNITINEANSLNQRLEANTEEIVRWKDYDNDVIDINYPLLDREVQALNSKVKVLENDSIESTPYNNQMVDTVFPNLHLSIDKLDKKVNDTKQSIDLNTVEINKLQQSINTLKNHNHDNLYLGINGTAQNSLKLGGVVSSVESLPNTIVKRDAQGRVNITMEASGVGFTDITGNLVGKNVSDALKELGARVKQAETNVGEVETEIGQLERKLNEVGTFTPTSVNNVCTYDKTETWGHYVRQGNVVHCLIYITVSQIHKPGNTVVIGGLPYKPKNWGVFGYLFENPKDLQGYYPTLGFFSEVGELYPKISNGEHPINLTVYRVNTGATQTRFTINFSYQIY